MRLIMTRDVLTEKVGALANSVVKDPRWRQDDLSVSVLGMLLYGFALATGRIALFLNMEDIDAAVLQCLTDRIGAAPKWAGGLVADANASAFNKAHHPGQYELIAVGHSYFGVTDQKSLVDNIFVNIDSVRGRTSSRR
jgi:hypothetical protein